MIPVQNCLQMASDRNANEILFHSHHPLRLRIGKDLIDLSNSAFSSQESRSWLSQVLDEEERKALFENMKLQGSKSIDGVSFKFDFQIDFEGINGTLVLNPASAPVWNLPAIVSESVLKSQGLNLIAGPRRSGKTAAIRQILSTAAQRKKVIAIYSDDESMSLKSEGNVVSQFPMVQLKQNGILRNADIIIIDSQSLDQCERALRLAEEGRSVVLTMAFWNISMALQRLMDLTEGSLESRARRISCVLQMALGLRLLPGIETPMQGVFELLLADSQVQRALRDMDFSALSIHMKNSAEKAGMRSLNQSLFQLLMKRKIELKTAFEASFEPEELDLLLKKVGI